MAPTHCRIVQASSNSGIPNIYGIFEYKTDDGVTIAKTEAISDNDGNMTWFPWFRSNEPHPCTRVSITFTAGKEIPNPWFEIRREFELLPDLSHSFKLEVHSGTVWISYTTKLLEAPNETNPTDQPQPPFPDHGFGQTGQASKKRKRCIEDDGRPAKAAKRDVR